MNSEKSSKFPRFSGEGVPFRRHAKTAVIPMVFIGSGASFLPRTPQDRNYWFLQESTINHKKSMDLAEFPVF